MGLNAWPAQIITNKLIFAQAQPNA